MVKSIAGNFEPLIVEWVTLRSVSSLMGHTGNVKHLEKNKTNQSLYL